MTENRVIAVVGATGAQGGGLVRAILADEGTGFRVRALTRSPESDAARELATAGADVVRADLDDSESMFAAFDGADCAFVVTNFWEHFSPPREVAQAQTAAKAAKRAGLRHVVWSTFEDTRKWVPLSDDRMPTLMEAYKVPHFDGKAEADPIFAELGVPTTLLRTSFYWDNFIHFGLGPKAGSDGTLEITLPMGDAKLPGIASEDIGKCALGIFRSGEEFIGETVGVAGEFLTGSEMAEAMGTALGREVRYNAVDPDVFRSFGFPGADDLGNMFQFKRDFNADYCGARDLELSARLNPALQTFDAWLRANADRIPLE